MRNRGTKEYLSIQGVSRCMPGLLKSENRLEGEPESRPKGWSEDKLKTGHKIHQQPQNSWKIGRKAEQKTSQDRSQARKQAKSGQKRVRKQNRKQDEKQDENSIKYDTKQAGKLARKQDYLIRARCFCFRNLT